MAAEYLRHLAAVPVTPEEQGSAQALLLSMTESQRGQFIAVLTFNNNRPEVQAAFVRTFVRQGTILLHPTS